MMRRLGVVRVGATVVALVAVLTMTVGVAGATSAAASGGGGSGSCGAARPRLVAVGDAGTVVTSTTGEQWTARTSGVTAALRAVTWGGGIYVGVGANGTVILSYGLGAV